MGKSIAEEINELPEDERALFFADLSEEEFEALEYDANFWLRPEQKIEGDDWFITALVAGRGFGKLCDVNHKLPTPNGWKRLGDIVDGDQVFDEYGRPCTVIQAHPIQLPKKAYKLTFSDGHTIVAGEEHLWTTWTHRDRKSYNRRNEYIDNDQSVGLPDNWPEWTKPTRWGTPSDIGPKVRTTQEIVDSFRHGKRGDLNHSIPVLANPLQYTEKVLPIDPYVYGAWLGDGSSSGPTMTSHVDESDWLINMFESRGYPLMSKRRAINSETRLEKNCNSISFYNLSSDLKYAQVFGNKNIIEDYRYGSEQQRRDVLAGLLDTDGFIDSRTHYIEFCSKREDHAKFVEELALSLGQKPKVYTGEATLNGKTFGTKYRVCWRPTENFFYMPRKARDFVPMGGQASRNMHRMIVDFEEVPVVPMRCLSVDSPNNLFLIGEGMIPTHNTRTAAEWVRKKAMENPGCRFAVAGRTVADVRNVMVLGESGILNVHPPSERPEYKQHTASIHWPNGSQALLLSSESPDQARGPQFHFAALDEFAAWKTTLDSSGTNLMNNIIAATRLGNNPQMLLATTPKKTKVMKDLMERSKDPEQRIRIISGSTLDNTSLSKSYIQNLILQYGDSDLARQEIDGVMLEDSEGIVFSEAMIEKARTFGNMPLGLRKIIAVDPSVSKDPKTADECGIMVIGATTEQNILQRKAFVIEDASLRAAPDVWAQRVVDMAEKYGITNVVAEANQGGALIEMVLKAKSKMLKVHLVHATKGKLKRVEPIVVAMQQGRVKLVEEFEKLEEQMLYYDPEMTNESPDRMDAFAWGCTALLVDPPKGLHFGGLSVSSGRGRTLLRPNQTQTARRKILGTMTHR